MKHLNDILKESLLDSEDKLIDNLDNAVKISRLLKNGYFIKIVEELYKKYKPLSIKSDSSLRSYQIRKYDPSKHYFMLVKARRNMGPYETYCIICNDKDGKAVGLDNYNRNIRHRRWYGFDKPNDDYDSFEEVITTYYHRPLKVCEVLPEDEWIYDYITKKIDY